MIVKYDNGMILEKINDNTAKVFVPLKLILNNEMPNFLHLLNDVFGFNCKYFRQYKSNMNKEGYTIYFYTNIIPLSEIKKG